MNTHSNFPQNADELTALTTDLKSLAERLSELAFESPDISHDLKTELELLCANSAKLALVLDEITYPLSADQDENELAVLSINSALDLILSVERLLTTQTD